jgi:hypothetical protein
MKDLLVDTIAGIVVAVIGVRLIKRKDLQIITKDLGKQINTIISNREKS